MNIFYVHEDPTYSAISLVDKHVIKMILESAQMLSTAHRLLDGEEEYSKIGGKLKKFYVLNDQRDSLLYKPTHINHPSSKWARESVENYTWLADHLYALLGEYRYRFNKSHKTGELFYYLQSPPLNLKKYDMTAIPCAMPEEYIISDDPVTNYRNYYNKAKYKLHKWTKRDKPEWIMSYE